MLKSYHHFFRTLFQLLDGATVVLSWFIAFWIRFELKPNFLPAPEEGIQFSSYSTTAVALVLIWFLSLQLLGAYKSWRSSRLGIEIFNVIKASLLAFVFFVSIQHFIARETVSRATLALFFIIVILGLVASRIFLRSVLSLLRKKGFNQRHIIYVGDTKLSSMVDSRLRLRPELGYKSIGVIVVSDGKNSSLEPLGQLKDLDRILTATKADHVMICLRNEDTSRLDEILKITTEHNVSVRIVPDISHYAILGFEVEEFEGLPVISLNQSKIVGWNTVLKRLSDIVYALVALAVFGVPMLIIAVIIKLTSKGPVLYSQERMGLDGQTFRMLKFRSMRTDAEAQSGAIWAKENDPRVTWIGGILRKTSLDELPQLFNVLAGSMSCVGPRPERPVFVEKFKSEVPGYMLRHKVKAGMTGWAQINGFRGNTSLEGRIEYDLYYISNWSVGLDLKIMFLTIFKGFIAPNAY